MARILGASTSPTSTGPNREPLPNPWAIQSSAPNDSFPSGFEGHFLSSSVPSNPTMPTPMHSTMNPLMNPMINPIMNPFRQGGHGPIPIPSMNNNFMHQYSLMRQAAEPVSTPTPFAPVEPVEIKYKAQLDTLRDMGFENEDLNKRAILAAGGNTEGAISYILDQQ